MHSGQSNEPQFSHGGKPANLAEILLRWRDSGNARVFPWRSTLDPYILLMTELMLRRTQAPQVTKVQSRFLGKWPDLNSFLSAKDSELLIALAPLGLKWRAHNFAQLRDELRKLQQIPLGYAGLTKLPGVGDYVASAVLCFSGAEARPLIDVNTVRVLCRYNGLPINDHTRRESSFRRLAFETMPQDRIDCADYHYALLDLAALVCIAGTPKCAQCPLNGSCHFARVKEHE